MTGIVFRLLVILTAFAVGAWAQERVVDDNGKFVEWKWPEVKLNAEEHKLLAGRSDTPKMAIDYYLALPAKYFRNVENSVERRVTFIERETLSDQYLHAEYWIPSVDAGGFRVTIRLFDNEDGEPLIAVRHGGGNKRLLENDKAKPGELIWVTLGRPNFYRFREGKWVPVDGGILPGVTIEQVLDRYRNHYKAHLKQPTQTKYIALGYELPRTGTTVRVTGRENFMNPLKKYVWATFAFDGKKFVPRPAIEGHASIEFSKSRYQFTVAEAAAGIAIEYTVAVSEELSGILPIPGGSAGMGITLAQPDGTPEKPGRLVPFETLTGNGQRYGMFDTGLPPPREERAIVLKSGIQRYTFKWDGRNWNGGSDTSRPKGDSFPPGDYVLNVSCAGLAVTEDGTVRFRVENEVVVKLVE